MISPFELGRVHRGEALALLEKIPADSIDAVITDPPYSSGGLTRSDRNRAPETKYLEVEQTALGRVSFSGDNRDGRSWCYWCALWLSECVRILKPGGYALMFSDWRQLPLASDAFQAGGLIWRGLIAWDKTECARAPHTGYFRHQAEFVVWGTKGPLPPAEHGGPWPGCYRVPVRHADKHHITGKPTHLMRQLVRVVPPGALVLDPFAGSGTTGVACRLEGRAFLGFEREEANVELANERIGRGR